MRDGSPLERGFIVGGRSESSNISIPIPPRYAIIRMGVPFEIVRAVIAMQAVSCLSKSSFFFAFPAFPISPFVQKFSSLLVSTLHILSDSDSSCTPAAKQPASGFRGSRFTFVHLKPRDRSSGFSPPVVRRAYLASSMSKFEAVTRGSLPALVHMRSVTTRCNSRSTARRMISFSLHLRRLSYLSASQSSYPCCH